MLFVTNVIKEAAPDAACRYYSNAVTDAEKQYAINVFLGDIMPEEKKVYPW